MSAEHQPRNIKTSRKSSPIFHMCVEGMRSTNPMYSMTPVKESRMTRNRSTALGIDDHDKDLLKVLRYLYKPTDPKTLTGEA